MHVTPNLRQMEPVTDEHTVGFVTVVVARKTPQMNFHQRGYKCVVPLRGYACAAPLRLVAAVSSCRD